MKTIYWGLLSLWLALAGCTKGVDDTGRCNAGDR